MSTLAEVVLAYAAADAPRVLNLTDFYSGLVVQQLAVGAIGCVWLMQRSFDLGRMIIAFVSSGIFRVLALALIYWVHDALGLGELAEGEQPKLISAAILFLPLAALFGSHWRAVQALAREPWRWLAVTLVIATMIGFSALPSQPAIVGPNADLGDSFSIYGQLRGVLRGGKTEPEPETPGGDAI